MTMSAAAPSLTGPLSNPVTRAPSLSETVVDTNAPSKPYKNATAQNTSEALTGEAEALGEPVENAAHEVQDKTGTAEIRLSQKRKWFLLLIFSVAQYLDIMSYSGIFIFTDAM